jgi:hypothetical protein
LVLGLLALASESRAAPLTDVAEPEVAPADRAAWRAAETADHCRHVTSVAASESALLWSPRMFSRFGLMRGSAVSDDGFDPVSRQPQWNLQAGVDLSPTRMYAGALVEARARAECRRYGAELVIEDLQAALVADEGAPWAARAAVLRVALPRAEERVAQSSAELEASRVSLQQHGVTLSRRDALQEALMEAEFQRASLARARDPSPRSASFEESAEELRRWEARTEELDARLRRVGGVGVSLRGGYDRVFGAEQSLPVFASVNVELVPGRLWQPARDRDGALARARSVERRLQGVRMLVTDVAERVAQKLDLAEQRLAQVDARWVALQAQHDELQQVRTPAALAFIEHTWFALVNVEADRAFARARVQGLIEQRARLNEVLRR